MTKYGQSIYWTDRDGTVTRTTTKGHSTPEDALRDALKQARAFGWTPPKWWQYWRWNDWREPKAKLKRAGKNE